jgi:arylsulfatase A-like enzyme
MSDQFPHVVLITCHDLGRHLACYGVSTVHSPHIDALAAAGVRFDRAFTVSPGCSPSRAALATGRYPHANGVMGLTHPPFDWDLLPGEQHIAQILCGAGYETHLFGFQHVSTDPDRLGFDVLHGYDSAHRCHERALGASVAARVETFLQARESLGPLYLEINLEEPHRPYDQGGCMPDDTKGVLVPPYLPPGPEAREEMSALQGAIRQGDAAVGRIVAALQGAGVWENVLLIFSADHGLAMPRAKCTLYDAGVEIALIMRLPETGLAGGPVVSEMVSIVDVLPTVLAALGITIPERVQGRSFLPLLQGHDYTPRSAILAEKTYHSYYDPMRAIRTERFKYIRNFEATFSVEVPADVQRGAIFRAHVDLYHGSEHPAAELYDLESDPVERRNLSGEPGAAVTERALEEALLDWMRETNDPLLEGPVPSPSYVKGMQGFRHR